MGYNEGEKEDIDDLNQALQSNQMDNTNFAYQRQSSNVSFAL